MSAYENYFNSTKAGEVVLSEAEFNAALAPAAQPAKVRPAIRHLALSWSVSRGRETYGYNICRLDDTDKGQRFKCSGGGYDMVGTVFAQWLCANYPDRLASIKDRAHYIFTPDESPVQVNQRPDSLYGMSYHLKGDRVHIDGACGLDSVLKIAEIIGLDIEREYIAKGRRRGETIGWFISEGN